MRVPTRRPTLIAASPKRGPPKRAPPLPAPSTRPTDPVALALALEEANASILARLEARPPPSTTELSSLRAAADAATASLAAAVGPDAAPTYRVAAAAARARAAAAALAPHVPRASGDAEAVAAARLVLATTGELLRLADDAVLAGSEAGTVDWEGARGGV